MAGSPFQHGRNRLYSYRDVIRYRWRSRKFEDNAPSVPYPAGARYYFDLVPETAATTKAPDFIDAHNAKIRASLEDAAREIAAMNRAGLPWPRPSI